MPFVLDASVAACWAFAHERHPVAEMAASRVRSDEAWAPALLWFELRNILIVGERRKRIAEVDTRRFLRSLDQMRVTVDRSPDENRALHLARLHGLTFYDAAYLELAQREAVPLATLDRDLAQAARKEGIAVLGD